jgi:hypothetical protein
MNEAFEERSAPPRRAKRPARERTHRVLTLLGVPAAPELIREVGAYAVARRAAYGI